MLALAFTLTLLLAGACGKPAPSAGHPHPMEFAAVLEANDPNWATTPEVELHGEQLRLGPVRSFAVASYSLTRDELGHAAIAFDLAESEKAAFTSWTGSLVDRRLAFFVDGTLTYAPTIKSALPGRGIAKVGLPDEECQKLLQHLQGSDS